MSCTQDFGAYRISVKRWLRRVCAYAQTRQSLRYSHSQSKDADVGSVLKHSAWAFLRGFCAYAVSTEILSNDPYLSR